MKKIMVVLFVSSLVIISNFVLSSSIDSKSFDDIDVYTYNFNNPIVEKIVIDGKSFSKIDVDECYSSGVVGEPYLPFFVVSLSIPLNKSVDSIKITPHLKYEFVLNDYIYPQQEYLTLSNDSKNDFSFKEDRYRQDKNILESQYTIQGLSYCRGYPIQTIILYPINYNPKQNKVAFYDSFIITISYKNQQVSKNPFFRNLKSDSKYVESFVDNPDVLIEESKYLPSGYASTYVGGICDPTGHYEYVIITNASLNDTTGQTYNWTSLLSFRTIYYGLHCTKITVEDIMACPDYWNATVTFNDTQARIREFCRDAYDDWETEYILIGGDWTDGETSQQMVSARMLLDKLETEPIDDMPSDLYYSNLDGTFYNTSDSTWGAGKLGTNDLTTELYVGRICAYNASMISNAISKIIWYENTSHNLSWLNNCSFSGADLGWTSTSKQFMESLRLGDGYYNENIGFEEWTANHSSYPLNTSNRYYYDDGEWNGFSVSIVNDNASIINNMGHSTWNTPFSLSGWSSRINTRPFFGYSEGCLEGRFISGNASSEQIMCYFSGSHSYGFEANAGYGWGDDTVAEGPTLNHQKLFWDYFFNSTNNSMSSWQLGKAHAYSKNKMAQLIAVEDRVWANSWYSMTLFGDPASTLSLYNITQNILFVGGAGLGNYSTISSAISNASNGYTIYVYPGVYYEHVEIPSGKILTLYGSNKDTTIIDGSSSGDVIIVDSSYSNITGFTIRNAGAGSNTGIELEEDYINIYNCIIKDNAIGIGLESWPDNCDIYDNLIIDNGYGVAIINCQPNYVYHNNFLYNDYHVISSCGYTNYFNKGTFGNYWDNWNGTTPYLVPNACGKYDNYPLSYLWNETTPFILSINNDVNQTTFNTSTFSINWTRINNTENYNLLISNDSIFTEPVARNITMINSINFPSNYQVVAGKVVFTIPIGYNLPDYKKYYVSVKAFTGE